MAVLEILLYPDETLTTPASDVSEVTDEVRKLVDDMVETMYDAPGIGLAAPQIGRDVRITVIDVANPEKGEEPDLHVLINPRITERDGQITWEEGCLSMPGLYRDVKRAERVTVRALDRDGQVRTYDAEGLLAVCMQHEIDHLDGIMFVDRLSKLRKRLALKEWKNIRQRILDQRERAAEEASKAAAESSDAAAEDE